MKQNETNVDARSALPANTNTITYLYTFHAQVVPLRKTKMPIAPNSFLLVTPMCRDTHGIIDHNLSTIEGSDVPVLGMSRREYLGIHWSQEFGKAWETCKSQSECTLQLHKTHWPLWTACLEATKTSGTDISNVKCKVQPCDQRQHVHQNHRATPNIIVPRCQNTRNPGQHQMVGPDWMTCRRSEVVQKVPTTQSKLI